ncbi:MAG: radical SAM protein [Oscillospiraceae bacterium]
MICNLCPRKCGVDRNKTIGFCGGTKNIKVAKASLHLWEEPCISGKSGSGTIFFSGCQLKCVFCQNFDISRDCFGKEISVKRLAKIFLELQKKGANNINLVSATQYVPQIIEALDIAKPSLKIPIIYNSSGYEEISTLKMLDGYIDIYLPDLKYYDSCVSKRYSNASDYFEIASKAIEFMFSQVGKIQIDKNGILQKGVIIRHLVLPRNHNDSIKIMEYISQKFNLDEIFVSVMSQYTPEFLSDKMKTEYSEINRKLFSYEYHKVLEKVSELSIVGFMQEKTSATGDYTPKFDLEGI